MRGFNRHTESLSGGEDRERRRAEGRARVRAWIARYREVEDLERDLGIYDHEARVELHLERRDRLEEEIVKTPARSVEGVAAKLRLYAHYEELDPDCTITGLAVAALRDAERLAGRAQS